MRAQMFIVTMVFLVGLVFIVQQNLFSYSSFNPPGPFTERETHILETVKNTFQDALGTDTDCGIVQANLESLKNYLENQVIPGHVLDIEYTLDCTNWNNTEPNPKPLTLYVDIRGSGRDLSASLDMYNPI